MFASGSKIVGGGEYIDRGDPASHDFTIGNFVTNGNWQDLDLSSIIPANVKLVSLFVSVNDDLLGSGIVFRKKGNNSVANVCKVKCLVINADIEFDLVVSPNGDKIIEYLATNTGFTTIYTTVRGWWL